MPTARHDNTSRIVSNSILLNARMVVVLGINLYTSRVIFEILGFTDFGIYNAVAGVVGILGFFTSSLSNAVQRYLGIGLGKNDSNILRTYFSHSLELLCITAILLLIIGETAGLWFTRTRLVFPPESLTAVTWTYRFALLSCIASIVQVPYMAAMITREKMNVYAYASIFEVTVKLASVFALKLIDKSDQLIAYSAALCVIQIIITAIYACYCMRFPECRFKKCWDKKLIAEMTRFVGYNLFGCFSYAAGYQGSNILLNIFFGPVMNAARAISFQVSSAVNRFSESIFTAVKPQIIKSYAATDNGYLSNLIFSSSTLGFLFMLTLVNPILFNTSTILDIWLKDVPEHAATFTQLAIIDCLIGALATPLWLALNATGNIRRNQTYGRAFILASLPLSYVCLLAVPNPDIPMWGLIMAQACYLIHSLHDVCSQLDIKAADYAKRVLMPICMASLPALALCAMESRLVEGDMLRLLITSATSTIIITAITYRCILSSGMRVLLTQCFTKQKVDRHDS
ncbi:MAG: hypothetical protein J6C78_01815 [Muribaculaceae bacterium]|nr:hypothetical protein [Muribaculaceae bacterium]